MKKILFLLTIISFLGFSFSCSATLYNYYHAQGLKLPSISERTPIAIDAGIDNYNGTEAQNKALESYLMGYSGSGSLGVALPTVNPLLETSLYSSITSNATTMTLVSGVDTAGNTLSGYYCFTVDSGTAQNEFVCGNVSSTSVTGLIRGIDPITGHTTVVALEFPHRRGADVRITDYPSLTLITRILNGQEGIPANLYYDSTSTTYVNDKTIATQGYVNNVGAGGFTVANVSTTRGLSVDGSSPERVGINLTSNKGLIFNISTGALETKLNANTLYADANGIGVDTAKDYRWTGSNAFDGTTTLATTTFSKIPTIPTTSPTTVGQVLALNDLLQIPSSSAVLLTNIDKSNAFEVISSATLKSSADNNADTQSLTYVKLKEIRYNDAAGIISASYAYQQYINNASSLFRLYKNGVAVGTERSSSGGAAISTEDITVINGDLIQVFASVTDIRDIARVRNFRLLYTKQTKETLPTVITN